MADYIITSHWKLVFAAFTVLLLSACEGDTRDLVNTVNAARLGLTSVQFVDLDDGSILSQGTTRTVTVTGNSDTETGITLPSLPIFKSSDSNVLSIDSNGTMRANNTGNAVISANYGGFTTEVELRVEVLVDITVSGNTAPDVCRTSQDLRATGIFESGEEGDITDQVIWTASSNARVEPLSNRMVEFAVRNLSEATLTATSEASQAISGSLSVIGQPTIETVSVSPTQGEVSQGSSLQFNATGTWTDGGTGETITSNINWTAATAQDSTGVATIDENGLATGTNEGAVDITGTCMSEEDVEDTATLIVLPPPTVVALEFYQGDVDDPNSQITISFEIDLLTSTPIFMKSRLLYSDNTYEDVTDTTNWSSSDSAVVQVGNLVPSDSNTDESTYKGALTGLQPSAGTQIDISYSQGSTDPNTNNLQIEVRGTIN